MIDKATGVVLEVEIECLNNTKSLKNLSRYLRREIDLEKLGLDGPNTELKL